MRSSLALLLLVPACSKPEVAPKQEPQTSLEAGSQAQESPNPEGPRVQVGKPAPEFSATAHTGEKVRLSDLRGSSVVLYFYPKDGTPGCTVEAEQFRDHHTELADAGAVILGVSSDDNESHKGFADEHGLPFLLLPDPEREIARAYGVGGFLGMSKRVTFLIDREGKVQKIYPSVTPKEHAKQILADLAELSAP